MTDLSPHHPSGLPYIELTEKGRKISFQKDCLGEVKIYRSVNEREPQLLIEQIRTPYTDEEDFPAGTQLTYTIVVTHNQEQHRYALEVGL